MSRDYGVRRWRGRPAPPKKPAWRTVYDDGQVRVQVRRPTAG